MRKLSRGRIVALLGTIGVAATLTACGGGSDTAASGGCDGNIDAGAGITVQWHQGAEAEVKAVQQMVKSFNASQSDVKATLKLVPEADYATSLGGQADSDSVPDVVDTDASKAFTYAWSGDLQPITNCVSDEQRAALLPSIVRQGTYANQLWALGMFDSGLAMYTTKSALKKANVRTPSLEEPWTAEEFTAALGEFKKAGYSKPLDLKKNYGQGEYYSYGFAPIVWSSGGNLLSDDYSTADGELNSDAAVKGLTVFQSWFKSGYVGDNTDDNDFLSGRSAVSWVGHWTYNDYKAKFGDDLLVVPLPDFGEGPRTGQGSWQWAVGSNADADAAWKFIEYTLQPEQQKIIATASGAIPAVTAVAEADPKFGPGGDLELYVKQHEEGISVPRPTTPAYNTVSNAFNQAIQDIIDGRDVKESLDDAVKTIDQDIQDNDGYPDPS
ncbi:MAG: extracellular solute-binding protein [Thermoleophilia bacterium]|nr:extracellular solute-binding protein [Thermoleophilia bacterium]